MATGAAKKQWAQELSSAHAAMARFTNDASELSGKDLKKHFKQGKKLLKDLEKAAVGADKERQQAIKNGDEFDAFEGGAYKRDGKKLLVLTPEGDKRGFIDRKDEKILVHDPKGKVTSEHDSVEEAIAHVDEFGTGVQEEEPPEGKERTVMINGKKVPVSSLKKAS